MNHEHYPVGRAIERAAQTRDYLSYTERMDAALSNKVTRIWRQIKNLHDNMVIVDAGAGTGRVAQAIAERANHHVFPATVIALDISDAYAGWVNDCPDIHPLYADAAERMFASNSLDVKYFSTSGHEIVSYGGGIPRLVRALENTFDEIKPGGQLIMRDFVKPSGQTPIYMQLTEKKRELFDDSLLSRYEQMNMQELLASFQNEFSGGNVFSYECVEIDNQEYVKISPEWAYEFYMRKEYTNNWQSELQEKYSYWTPEEVRAQLEAIGYTDVTLELEYNQFMIENWLKGQIKLFAQTESGALIPSQYPPTHMIISATKPF